MDGFAECFATASGNLDQFRGLRRELLRRVIALYPMIDAAIGEASDLRYRSAVLQRAVVGPHGDDLGLAQGCVCDRAQRQLVDRRVRPTLFTTCSRAARLSPNATGSAEEPAELRDACCSRGRDR